MVVLVLIYGPEDLSGFEARNTVLTRGNARGMTLGATDMDLRILTAKDKPRHT